MCNMKQVGRSDETPEKQLPSSVVSPQHKGLFLALLVNCFGFKAHSFIVLVHAHSFHQFPDTAGSCFQ